MIRFIEKNIRNNNIYFNSNILLGSITQIREFAKPVEKPAKDNTPKVKQSKGGKAKSGGIRGKQDKRNNTGDDSTIEAIERFVEVTEKAARLKIDFTDEEKQQHQKIAKNFAKQSQIRHNKYEKDLTTKIYLQRDALLALPEKLRIAAEVIDHEPPPSDRPMAVWSTPPIKGFDVRDYIKSNEDEDENDDNKIEVEEVEGNDEEEKK